MFAPRVFVLTLPEVVTRTEPSTASIADAPASTYVDPSSAVAGLAR